MRNELQYAPVPISLRGRAWQLQLECTLKREIFFISSAASPSLTLSLFLARHVMQFSVEIVQNIRKRRNGEETEEK